MKKLVLIMVILIVYMNVASCEDIINSNNLGDQETVTTTTRPIDNSQEYNRF